MAAHPTLAVNNGSDCSYHAHAGADAHSGIIQGQGLLAAGQHRPLPCMRRSQRHEGDRNAVDERAHTGGQSHPCNESATQVQVESAQWPCTSTFIACWCPCLGHLSVIFIYVSRCCVTRTLQVRLHSQRSSLQHRSGRTSASGCSHAAGAGFGGPPAAAVQLHVQGQGGVYAAARSGQRSQHVRVRRDRVLHESHRWEQEHSV